MNFSPWTFLLLLFTSLQLNAASLVLTFDQDTTLNNASGTTLTLIFANSTDNASTFLAGDFFDREWSDLTALGPTNLTNNVGTYPLSNIANTAVNITGSVTSTGVLNFGFKYSETDPSLGFTPFSFDRITGNRLRGLALWTAIDGAFQNFYLDSSSYNALGTQDDFVSAVPVPAAAWLFASGLLGLIGVARKNKV